ncbi:CheY-like chemotaxis protein [Devosia subaequoris]|uniref:CheY-like chemotaxis protein n=1 Tax=Devosia subaequoris TaxID=395930 RepID=A0A7W6IQ28_9HYPH|nr:CheY-like chemotaxis protein [Devosia subaequoris]MCP1210423.1 response regulator [Devosia subaequoris]
MQISPANGPVTTILVVDDDAMITLNTVELVRDMGHTALEAFSGAQALALMEKCPDITALITDYGMPGMTGIELANAARKLHPGLPILLTTGYDEVPDTAGHDFVQLKKPFREEELTGRLTELLAPAAG